MLESRPGNVRKTGLVVAIAVGMVAVGVVGLVVVSRKPSSAPGGTGNNPGGPPPETPPPSTAPVDIAQIGLSNVGKARVQYVDRNDPSRVAGQIGWSAVDPKPGGRAIVESPRATIFLRDGRQIAIEARRGTLLTRPGQTQPESGVFEGGVLGRLFQPDADGRVDTEANLPAAMFYAKSLSFDLALGEISTTDDFRSSGPAFEFNGHGLRALVDQVNERVQLIEVERTEVARFVPGGAAADSRVDGAVSSGAGPATPMQAAAVGKQPTAESTSGSTLYHAALTQPARITQRNRVLASPNLEIWLRVAGKETERAAKQSTAPAGISRGAPQLPATKPATAQARPAPHGETDTLIRPTADVVEARWAGPLLVVPAADAPPEAAGEQIAAKFTGTGSVPVEFSDADLKLKGHASAINVGATSGKLTILGAAGTWADIAVSDQGRMLTQELRVGLRSGVVSSIGPGELAGLSREPAARNPDFTGPPNPPRIGWSDQADFVFSTTAGANPMITDRLKQAIFAGGAEANDGNGGSASGGVLSVDFDAASKQPAPTHVNIREHALVDGGTRGSLGAEQIDAVLIPNPAGSGGGNVQLASITAAGEVTAQRDGTTMRCQSLDGRLGRDERGESVLERLVATDKIFLTGADGLEISADQLQSDVRLQVVDLLASGPARPVTIRRDGLTITGTQMRADGLARDLFVSSPGTLVAEKLPGDTTGQNHAEARWTSSMHFDDTKGTAECIGDAWARLTQGKVQTDTLDAQRVMLNFTPASSAGAAAPRRLISAEAFGQSLQKQGLPRATVDSRRFQLLPDGTQQLQRLIYMEGDRLHASETEGVVSVPGPGRLLVDDRTGPTPALPAPPAPGSPSSPPQPEQAFLSAGGAKGTSLFTWDGSLTLTKASGLLELKKTVRLLHRPSSDQPVITLDCDDAEATVQQQPPQPGEASPPGGSDLLGGGRAQLTRAKAKGSVIVRTEDGRRLAADLIDFDPVAGTFEATATEPETRVVFSEPSQPQPLAARKLVWHLRDGRIEIKEPMPISGSR